MTKDEKLKITEACNKLLALIESIAEISDTTEAEVFATVEPTVSSKKTKVPFTWSDSKNFGPSLSELKSAFPYFPDPSSPEELDTFWHAKLSISGRSLNHCMNRMNRDWELKSIRTPMGYRALREVAIDNRISIDALVWAMTDHPRFGKEGSLFMKAVDDYLLLNSI